MRSITRSTIAVPALGLAALLAAAGPAAAAPGHGGGHQGENRGQGAEVHQVDLDPLNDSGVEGKATLILRGDHLRVVIRAKGLTPNMLHPQHIHGLPGGTEAVCPPPNAADNLPGLPEEADNPDDFISLEEGGPFYGDVLLSLEPFPMANRAGVVTYSMSFRVNGDLLDLSDEAIVLHGRFLDDGYAATLPVACGEID